MVALSTSFTPSQGRDLGERRVAVVLNVNARKVDAETVGWMKSVVPGDDLFISESPEDGQRIAETIIDRGYDAVLWGGGDGTFAAGVAFLEAAARRRGCESPDVGILPFGTGNAIAFAVGAGKATPEGVAGDVHRARQKSRRRDLQMLSVEGKPTMFAGFGLDAQILDDHGKTVEALRRMGIADTVTHAGVRYFLSVTARSIPRFVASQKRVVVAVNRGRDAYRVDHRGNPVGRPIPAGCVLWRGQASLASAASIPFYGLGMKMFPHAEKMPGRFQLRLSNASTVEILANLPRIWKGQYESSRVFDFLVDEVELVVDRPAPFQSGGDLLGDRSRVTISLWDRPIGVV